MKTSSLEVLDRMGSVVVILLCQRLRGIGFGFFCAKRQHNDLSGLKNGLDAHGQSRVCMPCT